MTFGRIGGRIGRFAAGVSFFALSFGVGAGAAVAGTLDTVKERGVLHCGTNPGLAGFSLPTKEGEWAGFDVDFCRAIAAAVLGDGSKVKFIPLTSQERFTALQSGEVDLLSRNTTWTFTRDVNLGLEFAGITFYDGQGFMVKKALEVEKVADLDGARICIDSGTTTELNLADYFRTHDLAYDSVVVHGADDARTNYDAESCDAYTTDASGLASIRASLPEPSNSLILKELISKEPLGLVVRQGDDQWSDVVRWTREALVLAEELGVTSANVEEMKASSNPEVKRLLGTEGDFGTALGLDKDWAVRAVSAVGNYGEIFDRNVGAGSELKLERGMNALWSDGGLLYAPPMR